MEQLFYLGGKRYKVPDKLVSRFVEDYPDAEKAKRYKIGDKKYTVPESIDSDFREQYPDAKPYFPQLENPLGYTTESIQNIMQSERGMPKDYGDDVTLKVKDVSTLAENLKRVVNAEALPDSTKTVAKQSRIRDENENKMGFWEGASQDILEKIPFSPAGILKLIDLQNATIRLDLLERGDDYGYRMYEKVPAYSMTTMGGIAPVMGAGATPESDIKLINDYFNKVAERERRGSSTGGKIGAGLSVLPAWMIEFMVTGGLKNIVEKGTYNFLENRLKSQIINKTLSSVAGSAARTTLGMPHRVIESSLRRSIENPDEGWATALAKGWGETFIEVASEETGGTITKILGKGLTKLPFGSKFINAIRKVHPRGSQPGFASELLTKGGYSNIIGELGEERVATILHAIANTNDFGLGKDSNIIDRLSAGISQDWSNIPVELVVLGVPGAAKLVSQYAEVKSLKDKVDNPATKEKLQTELNNIREQVDNVLEKSSGVIVNEGDIPILKTVPTELQSLYQKQTDLYRQLKSEENPNKIHSLESQLDPLTDQINSYVYGKPKVEAGKVETKSVPEEGGLILPTDISNKIKSDKVQELEKQYSKTESILKRVKKPETRARLEGELDNISKQLEIALETAKPTEESTVAGIKPQEAEQTIPEQGAKPIAEPQVMPVAQQTPETKAEMPTKPEKPAEAVKSALEKAQVSESFANRYKIVETPLSEINIDVKSYQNRGEAYSQETYDSILNDIRKGEFDWKRFKPIVLWDNPKTGTRDLLEGHSRKAAFEQAVKEGYTEFETIPSYIAKGGTFEEAQRFAKEQSNVGQTREMDYERAKIYRSDREGGMSKKDILAKAVNLEGRRAAPYIVRLSHLDPRGDSIRLIESLKNSADKNEVGRAEKIADWIGRARDKYPELTNLHETEIFKWLFGDQDNVGMAIRFNTVNQFLDRVDAVVNRIGFEQDKPLNIKNLSVKSEGELQYAEEISNIDKELKQANKHRADIATRLSEQGLNPDEISKNEIHRQATADVVALERNLERLRLGESNVKAESRKQTNLFDSAIKLTKTELKNEGLTDEQVRRTESVFSGRKESEIADFESKIESIQAQEKPRPENPKPSRTTGEEVRAGINTAKPAEKLSVSTIPDAKYIGMQERPDGSKFPLFNITKEGHPRQGSTVSAETLKELNLKIPEMPKQTTQKLSPDQRRAVEEIKTLQDYISNNDAQTKAGLPESKKAEYTKARKAALDRIDYLNKKFNLEAGEYNIQLFPGARKLSKAIEKEISTNKQIIATLEGQQKAITAKRDKYQRSTDKWNSLDNDAQGISDKINALSKSMSEKRTEILGVKESPKDRKTMLAYAHILERDAAKRGINYTDIKKDIGVESLKDANNYQLNDYINKLKPIPKTIGKEVQRKSVSESLTDQEWEAEPVLARISRKTKQNLKSFADLKSGIVESMEHSLNTKFGKATKEFVTLKRAAELQINGRVNPLTSRLEQLYSKIPIKERNALKQIIENPDAIKHSQAAQDFVDWYRAADNEMFNAGKIINPDVKYIKNHFPVVLKPATVNIDLNSEYGEKVVDFVAKNLRIRTNTNVTNAQAKDYLIKYFNNYKKHGSNSLYGVFIESGRWKHDYPIELHRERVLPEIFYENNVYNVLHKYLYSSWEAIEYAKLFGKAEGEYKYKKIDDLLKRVESDGYDAELARDMIATVLHLKSFSHNEQMAVKMATDLTTLLLSGKTSIKNIGDLNKTISLTNEKNVIEYFLKSMVSKEERQLARDIIGSKDIFMKSLEEAGITGKVAEVYTKMILFQKSEKLVRKSTAMSAIHWCEHTVNHYNPQKSNKFQDYLKRRFTELSRGLDIDGVKNAGGLTREQKIRIGLNAIGMTQPTSALDKPYYWESKAIGQMATRFKPFGHKSLRFAKDFTLKEMAKGNPLPFMRWVAWGIAMGYTTDQLTQFIFPKDDEGERQTAAKFALNLVEDFASSGHLGFLGDLIFMVKYAGWYSPVIGFAFGPLASVSVDNAVATVQTASNIIEKKPVPLEPIIKQGVKYTVKRVPFAGEKWYRDILDNINRDQRLRGSR